MKMLTAMGHHQQASCLLHYPHIQEYILHFHPIFHLSLFLHLHFSYFHKNLLELYTNNNLNYNHNIIKCYKKKI